MAGVLKAKVGGQWVPIVGSGMTAEVARWNSAWGVVATASTQTQQSITTVVDLNGLSVTLTPPTGRMLLVTLSVVMQCDTVNKRMDVMITDAPNTVYMLRSASSSTVSGDETIVVQAYVPATGVAMTFKGRAQVGSGTMTMTGGRGSFIAVEDVGPVIYNAAPAPIGTPTAWTAPTFQNGWTNYGSGFQTAAYRQVGDIVSLRGIVAKPSALSNNSSSMVCTLPVGFRPSLNENFTCNCWGAAGQGEQQVLVQVAAAGSVYVIVGGNAAAQNPHLQTSLSGIQFSITA